MAGSSSRGRGEDAARLLIEERTAGNYGLARQRWIAQLEAIRALPETKGDTRLTE